MAARSLVVGLNAVIVAVTDEAPRLLTVERAGRDLRVAGADAPALPFGPLDPAGHRTLELGLRGWVREQTGLDLGYAEQLYTFGDRHRDPRERAGGPRMISIAYLALVREGRVSGAGRARWRGFYEFLPWEDSRAGRPALVDSVIAPAVARWVQRPGDAKARRTRRERADITFGLRGATFDTERVLERYELLYEAGLVPEARRDRSRTRARSGHEAGGAHGPRPPASHGHCPRAPAWEAQVPGPSSSSSCPRPSPCSACSAWSRPSPA